MIKDKEKVPKDKEFKMLNKIGIEMKLLVVGLEMFPESFVFSFEHLI
jgi:hypothetical protein